MFLVESIDFYRAEFVSASSVSNIANGGKRDSLFFLPSLNSTPVSFVLWGVSRYGSGVAVLGVLGASLHTDAQAW
jgi:hypothetical protein